MIFQQPHSSLNPVFTIGAQIAEVLRIHMAFDKDQAWARAVELLKQVGIADAESKAQRVSP